MKILLVDDERLVRLAVRGMIDEIAPGEHQITEAKNGQEAVTCLRAEPFDLALIDYRLPPGSGLDIVRQMRDKSRLTRWVILSGYEKPALVAECVEVDAWFQKPVSVEDIRRILQKGGRT